MSLSCASLRIKSVAHLPSVATWLSGRVGRVAQRCPQEHSSLHTEIVAALGSSGSILQAASKDVASHEACEAWEVLETSSVYSVSTVGGAASRTSRRAHLRKAAKNHVSRGPQREPPRLEEEKHKDQTRVTPSDAPLDAPTQPVLHDKSIQCSLARDELQKLDVDWRDKYEELRKRLNNMRLSMTSETMKDGADLAPNIDTDVSSEDSWVCGFSDYGDGGGRGTKIVMNPLPESYTREDIQMLLKKSSLPVPNFIGIKGSKAAVFCNKQEHAQKISNTLNFTALGNNVFRVKLEKVCDEDMGDQSFSSDELRKSVEVGDIALVTGLLSDAGRLCNGMYGKVIRWDDRAGRFGIMLAGKKTVAVKPVNLEIGLRAEEAVDDDEEFYLNLQPSPRHQCAQGENCSVNELDEVTFDPCSEFDVAAGVPADPEIVPVPERIRALPFLERIKAAQEWQARS